MKCIMLFLFFVFILGCGGVKPIILSENKDEYSYICDSDFSGKIIKFNDKSMTKTKELSIKNGKLDGLAITWDIYGRKISEKEFSNNIPDGKFLEWWPNGKNKIECLFKSGKEIYRKEWDADGALLREQNLNNKGLYFKRFRAENGEVVENEQIDKDTLKVTRWFLKGIKKSEAFFKDEKLNGKFTSWNDQGTKIVESEYKDNVLNGRSTIWNNDGKLLADGNFENGIEIKK